MTPRNWAEQPHYIARLVFWLWLTFATILSIVGALLLAHALAEALRL